MLDKEKARIRQLKYDSKPEVKIRKSIKAHERYLRTRDQQIAYGKEYRKINAEWRNQKERDKSRHLRMEILLAYGGKCSCLGCNEWRYEFLTMHHIDNDGASHRKEIKYGSMYEWIKAHDLPLNFRVLCWNCNLALGKYGYCPHELTPNA